MGAEIATQTVFRVTDLKTLTVATPDVDAAVDAFRTSFGFPITRSTQDGAAETRSEFLAIGTAEIEMTAPTAAGGPLARALGERGAGLYRLELEVNDLELARAELEARGIEVSLGPRPDGRLVGSLDPRHTHGVPIALVER